ncbi:MAG: hypothetical protein GTO63_09095 [Anaerolineae bacterium]|nr:hypothetical protein [Anaerolineae bacterium]NIN95043.1 hypothetical protein [Anaerolineae bacterium]NIQ78082.1 hypothetical protein [Anaerolineae bacterium]
MTTFYDTYPGWLVALTISEIIAALALSVMIIAPFGWWAVGGYGALGLATLASSLAFGCTRCHYYGRLCGTGLGRVAALIFGKREEEEFGNSPSQMLAWTLVGITLLIPLAGGLAALSGRSSILGLMALATYVGLLIVISVTHSRLVCYRCHEARHKRCTLGRLGKSL